MVSALPVNLDANPSVTIVVMKSYDQATAFLNQLRRLLLLSASALWSWAPPWPTL